MALLSGSKTRQEVFSWELHYLLVSTIRNRPQIANEKSTIFKTEFFNSIGQEQTFEELPSVSPVFRFLPMMHLRFGNRISPV